MTATDLLVLAAGALAVVALVVVLVLLGRLRADSRRTAEELRRARDEAAQLRARLDELDRRASLPDRGGAGEFVITSVGVARDDEPEAPALEGRLFADLVLRESVVKAASLAHGLRRAMAPETRNRIRFEMRRELRRARRRRREELRGLRRGVRAERDGREVA